MFGKQAGNLAKRRPKRYIGSRFHFLVAQDSRQMVYGRGDLFLAPQFITEYMQGAL